VLARYRPNGTLDPSFGNGGKVRFGSGAQTELFAVAIRPDGRIVVSGAGGHGPDQFAGMVATFSPRGRIDRSFGSGGRGLAFADLDLGISLGTRVALQRNGKIVISGVATDVPIAVGPFVARFTARGRVDRSFGIGGSHLFLIGSGQDFTIGGGGLGIQPDGRIVGAGTVGGGGSIAAMVAKRFFGDPPQTRLGKARLGGSSARFSFGAVPADGATFRCALRRGGAGGAKFAKCSSPRRFSGLRPGRYTFEVRARSVNGSDPSAARRSFVVH